MPRGARTRLRALRVLASLKGPLRFASLIFGAFSAAIIVPAPREASERVSVSIFVRLGVNPFAPHLPRVFRMPREIAFVER